MSIRRMVMATVTLCALFSVYAAPATRAHAQGTRVNLDDAIRQGIIKAQLNGSDEPFFQQSLAYHFENLKGTGVTIVIPLGLIVNPDDESYQSLVVSKEQSVNLAPNGSAEGKAFAFCINLEKHAPDEGTEYQPGRMASGPLVQVVQAIDRKGGAGRLGAQLAVWRVTDNFTLESLSSSEKQNSDLIQLILPFLSLARPEIDFAQDVLTDSKTGLKFYTGTPPPNLFDPGGLLNPSTSTGIPEVDAVKKQVEDLTRNLAIAGGALVALCGMGCVGLVALILLVSVVLRKR